MAVGAKRRSCQRIAPELRCIRFSQFVVDGVRSVGVAFVDHEAAGGFGERTHGIFAIGTIFRQHDVDRDVVDRRTSTDVIPTAAEPGSVVVAVGEE